MTEYIKCIVCKKQVPKQQFNHKYCSRICKTVQYKKDKKKKLKEFRKIHPLNKEKKCLFCKKIFIKTNNRQIYCNNKCFNSSYYIINNKKINDAHKKCYYKYKKEWNLKRKEKLMKLSKKERQLFYKKKNNNSKEYRKEYYAKKRLTDSIYTFNKDLSRNLSLSLNRINYKKDNTTYKTINVSKPFLIKYIKNQFTKKMNFNNRGKIWDIGHRIPLAWFKNKNELIRYGWNFKNIFPVETYFNRYIQNDNFAFINNKKFYNKKDAIKELFGDENNGNI